MMLAFSVMGESMSITQSINIFLMVGKSSHTSDLLGIISHANPDCKLKDVLVFNSDGAW